MKKAKNSNIGRPRGTTKTKVSLTIDDDVLSDARKLLKKDKRSLSQFAVDAMELLLKQESGAKKEGPPSKIKVHSPANISSITQPKHWLDLCGGIAAGSQIATDAPSEPIPVAKAYEEDCYALRVFGQSMEPKIADGSLIVVQRMAAGTFPKKESIVVYSDAYGLSLKQLAYRKAKADEDANAFGKVAVLKSLNPKFPEIQTMDGGKIEAVLVEVL